MRMTRHDRSAGPEERAITRFLETSGACVLTRLVRVEGSAPRSEGTFMLVSARQIHGTIGGGFAEFDTIDHARTMLQSGATSDRRTITLGPDSGQCCGGRLTIDFLALSPQLAAALISEAKRMDEIMRPVMLFGAGHVGKALAQALSPLPLSVTVIETRKEELEGLPENVRAVATPLPEGEVRKLGPGGAAIIMTHDHALDFLIAREALTMDGLAYVGMIGSATKRASFAGYWKREGGDPAALDRLVIPVGGQMVKDKRPAVIAAMVAAELLCLPPYPVIVDEQDAPQA